MRNVAVVTVGLVLAAACASRPDISYYTFDMDPSGRAEATVNLEVESIRTTEPLAKRQMLIQPSPTRVEYYAVDEWAGGLGELVAEKLRSEFGPGQEGRRTLSVSGTVLACEQVDGPAGAEARARMRVVLRDPTRRRYEDPLLVRTYQAVRAVEPSGPAALARALSACLEQIAADIADDASLAGEEGTGGSDPATAG